MSWLNWECLYYRNWQVLQSSTALVNLFFRASLHTLLQLLWMVGVELQPHGVRATCPSVHSQWFPSPRKSDSVLLLKHLLPKDEVKEKRNNLILSLLKMAWLVRPVFQPVFLCFHPCAYSRASLALQPAVSTHCGQSSALNFLSHLSRKRFCRAGAAPQTQEIFYVANVKKRPHCFFSFLFRAMSAAYGGSQARVESDPQLPAYTPATTTQDPSFICNLRATCSNTRSLTHWAKDGTHILRETRWVLNLLSHNGNSRVDFLKKYFFFLSLNWPVISLLVGIALALITRCTVVQTLKSLAINGVLVW